MFLGKALLTRRRGKKKKERPINGGLKAMA
jgi:hypothetical protein